MTLSDFKKKVQKRILTQFFLQYTKQKKNWYDHILFGFNLLTYTSIAGFLMSLFITNPWFSEYPIELFFLSFSFFLGMLCFCIMNGEDQDSQKITGLMNLKRYFCFSSSYKKHFNIHVGNLPIIEYDIDLYKILRTQSKAFIKQPLSENQIYDLCRFNKEEYEEFKNLDFNEEQKNLIWSKIKSGTEVTYIELENLFEISNEKKLSIKNIENENILKYADLANILGKDIEKETKIPKSAPTTNLKHLL